LAHQRITTEELERLESVLKKMKHAVADCNTQSFYEDHLRFHEIFIKASGNELLINTLTSLRTQSLWHRFSFHYYQDDLNRSFAVHRKILDNLSTRSSDPIELRNIVENHINMALDSFLVYLETLESDRSNSTQS
ncbi:MAG: GntR family transcriptional regulator, partial [Desulfocapsaceae bacterium]